MKLDLRPLPHVAFWIFMAVFTKSCVDGMQLEQVEKQKTKQLEIQLKLEEVRK